MVAIDAKGNELIRIHAQYDMDTAVLHDLNIHTEVVADDIETASLVRKGEAVIDDELLDKIKDSYKKLYQSAIQYNFSEYKIKFTINLKYNKYNKLAELAECYIEEEVLNNLENVCSYIIKRVKT